MKTTTIAMMLAAAVMVSACGAEQPEAYCSMQSTGLVMPTCDGMIGDGVCADADDEDWQVDCGQFGGGDGAYNYAACDGYAAVCRSTRTSAVSVVPRCFNVCKL